MAVILKMNAVIFFTFCSLAPYAQKNAQKSLAIPGINADSLRKELRAMKAANKLRAAKIQFRYFVIRAPENSFGYDIYADGNLYIHQNSVPGIGGNKAFADTASAGKTARFAIKKIKEGELPPTITEKDLRKLGVRDKHPIPIPLPPEKPL